MGDAHVLKSSDLEQPDQLRLRQGTGDSTRPEVDVVSSALGELHIDDDVR